MPLDTLPSEDDIVARLKTIPAVDVIEGEYTSDGYIPVLDSNKLFKPYITVKFNGTTQTYDHGICDPGKDTMRASFSIYVVSPDDRVTRQIRSQARELLLSDFRPTDGSYLRPIGGFSFVDSDLGYNRYVSNNGFSYQFNLS